MDCFSWNRFELALVVEPSSPPNVWATYETHEYINNLPTYLLSGAPLDTPQILSLRVLVRAGTHLARASRAGLSIRRRHSAAALAPTRVLRPTPITAGASPLFDKL